MRIEVKAKDLWRLRELQAKMRKHYPFVSNIQIERMAWNAYLKEKENNK